MKAASLPPIDDTSMPGLLLRGRFVMPKQFCAKDHDSVANKCVHGLDDCLTSTRRTWWLPHTRSSHLALPLKHAKVVPSTEEKVPEGTMVWDAPPISLNVHVVMYVWCHADSRAYAAQKLFERVNLIGEEYMHDTLSERVETKAESVPVYWKERVVRYRGRFAFVQQLAEFTPVEADLGDYKLEEEGAYGYMPRSYLMALPVWHHVRGARQWYTDRAMGKEDAWTHVKAYNWRVGDFFVHPLPMTETERWCNGQTVYHMYVLLPVGVKLRAANNNQAVQIQSILIGRDPFGRYIYDHMMHRPYTSLMAMIASSMGAALDTHSAKLETPPCGVWLRGGPKAKEEGSQPIKWSYPPAPLAQPNMQDGALTLHERVGMLPNDGDQIGDIDIKELTAEEVQYDADARLGEGNFGVVYLGKLTLGGDEKNGKSSRAKEIDVAVKVVDANKMEGVQKAAVRRELQQLSKITHEFCVRTYGVLIDGQTTGIVMELMKTSALSHLRQLATKGERLGTVGMLTILYQVASAMAYLESINIVHRDLALRNVLLASIDPLLAKVADFGLAVRTAGRYVRDKETEQLPFAWMAPEAIMKHVFTNKTDVWSYGVLAWEIMTLGGEPFAMIDYAELANVLRSGLRLERPPDDDVPNALWLLVEGECWHFSAQQRPSFGGKCGLKATVADLLTTAKSTADPTNDRSPVVTKGGTHEKADKVVKKSLYKFTPIGYIKL